MNVYAKPSFWVTIVLIALAILFVFWIVRVNPPEDRDNAESKPIWSEGIVHAGTAHVGSGKYIYFRLNLNKRGKLSVHLLSDSRKRKITAKVFSEREFEQLTAGEVANPLIQTGRVSRANIRRLLEPGIYYVVLDNRESEENVNLSSLEISVE